jgi:cell division protein FtsN
VQVAAYDSREPAQRLVNLLKARGIDARVDGTARPYRVRVGRYASRAEAARMQGALRAQGYNGFIALVR